MANTTGRLPHLNDGCQLILRRPSYNGQKIAGECYSTASIPPFFEQPGNVCGSVPIEMPPFYSSSFFLFLSLWLAGCAPEALAGARVPCRFASANFPSIQESTDPLRCSSVRATGSQHVHPRSDDAQASSRGAKSFQNLDAAPDPRVYGSASVWLLEAGCIVLRAVAFHLLSLQRRGRLS